MSNAPNRPRLSKAFGFIMAEMVVLHGVRLNDDNLATAWDSWLRSVETLGLISIEQREKLSRQGPRKRAVLDAIRGGL